MFSFRHCDNNMCVRRVPSVVWLVFFLLVSLVHESHGEFDVRLYAKKQLEGRYIKLRVHEACVNLPDEWASQVHSIDTRGCIIVYADKDCRGLRRRLDRWSWGCSNLKEISFDNKLVSLAPCPAVKKPVINVEDEL